jgi:hypothetical protein
MTGTILAAFFIAAVIVGLVLPEREKVGKKKRKIEKILKDKE